MKLPCLYCKPEERREGKKIIKILKIHSLSWSGWIDHIKAHDAKKWPWPEKSQYQLY